jgi:hypothetical protein
MLANDRGVHGTRFATIAKNALAKLQGVKVGAIGAAGYFAKGSSLDVVENWSWKSAPGCGYKITQMPS